MGLFSKEILFLAIPSLMKRNFLRFMSYNVGWEDIKVLVSCEILKKFFLLDTRTPNRYSQSRLPLGTKPWHSPTKTPWKLRLLHFCIIQQSSQKPHFMTGDIVKWIRGQRKTGLVVLFKKTAGVIKHGRSVKSHAAMGSGKDEQARLISG